jgi:hypothetical protein
VIDCALLNNGPELRLQAATVFETLRANGLLKDKTEREINAGDISEYLNNYQKTNEETNLETSTAGNTTSDVSTHGLPLFIGRIILGNVIRRLLECS